MSRPEFSEREEGVIARVRYATEGRMSQFWHLFPWLVTPLVLFGFGLYKDSKELMFVGFGLCFYLQAQQAFHQIDTDVSWKQILNRYEASLEEAREDEESRED